VCIDVGLPVGSTILVNVMLVNNISDIHEKTHRLYLAVLIADLWTINYSDFTLDIINGVKNKFILMLMRLYQYLQ